MQFEGPAGEADALDLGGVLLYLRGDAVELDEEDRARGFVVDEGLTVLAKQQRVEG